MNTFYLVYNKNNKDEVYAELEKITDQISMEDDADFKLRFSSVKVMYDTVVIIMLGIAILMSLLVLTNLNNILVMHKKQELIVMRVNGFSLWQTAGYLIRETVFVTFVGMLLAVVTGMLINSHVMRILEQPDVQFIREPSLRLWLSAALIEAVFMAIISTVSFWKIRKLSLREIAEE